MIESPFMKIRTIRDENSYFLYNGSVRSTS